MIKIRIDEVYHQGLKDRPLPMIKGLWDRRSSTPWLKEKPLVKDEGLLCSPPRKNPSTKDKNSGYKFTHTSNC